MVSKLGCYNYFGLILERVLRKGSKKSIRLLLFKNSIGYDEDLRRTADVQSVDQARMWYEDGCSSGAQRLSLETSESLLNLGFSGLAHGVHLNFRCLK